MTLQRHDLVWIARTGPVQWHASDPLPGDWPPIVDDWRARGRPFIARRRCSELEDGATNTGHVPVGLPLAPARCKLRLALSVARAAIARVRRPPMLEQARAVAPPAWHDTLMRILAAAGRNRVQVHVYGSLAWQWMTGLAYVTQNSDLDLLLRLTPASCPAALLEELACISQHAPMRLDGEVVRDDGVAAQWQELHRGAQQILVRNMDSARLMSRCDFLQESRA